MLTDADVCGGMQVYGEEGTPMRRKRMGEEGTSEAHGPGVTDKHSSTKEAITAEGARGETRMRCKELHLSSVS